MSSHQYIAPGRENSSLARKRSLRHGLLSGFTLLCSLLPNLAASQKPGQLLEIKGRVCDANTDKPLSQASIQSVPGHATISDQTGDFKIGKIPPGTYHLSVRHVGYTSVDTVLQVSANTQTLIIRLHPKSIMMAGVEVLAQYKDKRAGSIRIEKEAIEYIQPTSLRDLLLLLPGNVIGTNRFNSFAGISSRQVGADANTSLGTIFVMDGMPVTNDADRLQLAGLTGMDPTDRYVYDRTVTNRTRPNAGMDMRTISTDHIASVNFERGISSASEGNLSSGLVHIRSKSGNSPLQTRVKLDPLNKLGYTGKGFKFSKERGTLYAGLDLLQNKTDVRELLESYLRSTVQLNYDKSFALDDERKVALAVRLHQTVSVENEKSDELQREYNERYRSSYYRTMLSAHAQGFFAKPWLHSAELLLSADYGYNLLARTYFYLSSDGSGAIPQALTPGEHPGIYLPTSYHCHYKVENKPLYINLRIRSKALPLKTESAAIGLHYGYDLRLAKNYGFGIESDPMRPPYPRENKFIRPRPNYTIPALGTHAAFLETNPAISLANHTIQARIGLRLSSLFNLPAEYTACARPQIEPRINANWKYHRPGGNFSFNFRLGYGHEIKWPTLDQLYPDKVYRDFIVLNAFTGKPENSRLITYTVVRDPTNPNIKPNTNHKLESGIDLSIANFDFSITAFLEHTDTGFDYSHSYYPVAFDRYVRAKRPIPPGVIPNKEDFIREYHQDFTAMPTVMNAARVRKLGIEYRLRSPYLSIINTQIELNGAYYHTTYSSSNPQMYRPEIKEMNALYPYVGIYAESPHLHRTRLNTNVWINTKVPAFRLIFTNFIQILWRETYRNGYEESEFPYAYLDYTGVQHPTSKEQILLAYNKGELLKYLSREHTPLYYRPTVKPTSVRLNFKGTKEFSDKVRVSFFVDNIIDLSPRYKGADKTTERDWFNAYFGLETSISL